MPCHRLASIALLAMLFAAGGASAAEPADAPRYDLTPRLAPGDSAEVTTSIDVGGDLLVTAPDGPGESRLPLSIVAKLQYHEQLLHWSSDVAEPVRAVRRYSTATANTKTDARSEEQSLAPARGPIVAESSQLGFAMSTLTGPLTRNEFILLDAVGNTLVIDRLLPGKELAEGEGWDHDPYAIGALLGMDHVAVCDVRSVVTGEDNRQVQIRMAGTVHGTVNGSSTEMELRAAYLFHLDCGRITKLNLAVKELLKPGDVAPGLDVVAKIAVVAAPRTKEAASPFEADVLKQAAQMPRSELRELLVDAADRGFRFRQDLSWFVVHESRELTSFKLIDEGELVARCSIATAPPRPAGKPMTLMEFEKDVVKALGEKVGKVAEAREWTTPNGCQCLGVFVDGKVSAGEGLAGGVDVQWRYYHVSGENLPQATVAVTVEQMLVERFANADRQIIDSLQLVPMAPKTAAAVTTQTE
ncbi:MAG TPA: hypothetical protein VEQ85_10855 [Lacipirellulaceae bacterium]|nr:hypothetical protein [Lacipirellulaceae bacterium]